MGIFQIPAGLHQRLDRPVMLTDAEQLISQQQLQVRIDQVGQVTVPFVAANRS